jgi:hypothetical protein
MVYQLFFETEGSRQFYGEYRDINDMLYFFNELMNKGAISSNGDSEVIQFKASDIKKIEVICLARE